MGTRQDSSLKGYNGRILPPGGPRNHPDTVHKAPVYSDEQKTLSFAQGRSYSILTFSMDTPVQWDLLLSFTDIADPTPPGIVQVHREIQLTGDVQNPALNTIYTPNVDAAIDPFTQGRGRTITNNVPVRGYLGTVGIPNYALTQREGAIAAVAEGSIFLWCQAPQMFGWPTIAFTFGGPVPGPDSRTYNSIYLGEQYYTDAIRKAGNIISFMDIMFVRVVGLIAIIPLIP